MEMKVRIQGVDHKAHAQLIKGTLWVHHDGQIFTMDVSSGKKARKKGGASGSADHVSAPMPGKVTKLLVQVGAVVTAGQPVLVMEAMKMEYTLKAEIEGTIASIDCQVGEQVPLGKTLVKLKAESTSNGKE